MASITTRAAKGTPLTHAEVDANFTNLNTDKLDVAGIAAGTAASPTVKFTGDTNTGIYSPGADQLSISTGGTERFRIDSNGQLEAVSLGSAANPAYSFTTDPDTGLYSPGANQVALATGGTGRFFVDANGRVGIGTSSPERSLDVAGYIQVPSGAFGGGGYLFRYRTAEAASRSWLLTTDDKANGDFIISTSSTQTGNPTTPRFYISPTGLVGIGTTSPIANGGILQLSSGITFPAVQIASADPNTLDDYEEGTWTPVLRGSGTAGTYELSRAIGIYTKVGRQVTLTMSIQLAGTITGGGTGYTQISGLPFQQAANSFPTNVCRTIGVDISTNYTSVFFQPITAASTSTWFLSEAGDNVASNDLPIAAFSAGDIVEVTVNYIA